MRGRVSPSEMKNEMRTSQTPCEIVAKILNFWQNVIYYICVLSRLCAFHFIISLGSAAEEKTHIYTHTYIHNGFLKFLREKTIEHKLQVPTLQSCNTHMCTYMYVYTHLFIIRSYFLCVHNIGLSNFSQKIEYYKCARSRKTQKPQCTHSSERRQWCCCLSFNRG